MTTSANIPVQFLYEHDGYFWYSAHCCDFEDPHTGIVVTSEALTDDELGCENHNEVDDEMVTHTTDGTGNGGDGGDASSGSQTGQHAQDDLDTFTHLSADNQVGNREPEIKRGLLRVSRDRGIIVSNLIAFHRVRFRLAESGNENLDHLSNRVFSLRRIQASFQVRQSADDCGKYYARQAFIHVTVADRCRRANNANARALTVTNAIGSSNFRLFYLELETAVLGMRELWLVNKTKNSS